jgi:hypothetical protein
MIVIIDKIPMITKVHTVASAISLVVMFFNDSLIWIDVLLVKKMPGNQPWLWLCTNTVRLLSFSFAYLKYAQLLFFLNH